MRSRASITRTRNPASTRLRAAERPAIPAPTTRTGGASGCRGSFEVHAPASPPPTTLVVAATKTRRVIGETGVSVSHGLVRAVYSAASIHTPIYQIRIGLRDKVEASLLRQRGRVQGGSGDEHSTID